MTKRTEDWENELWSYVKAGDGIRCPVSDSCQLRKDVAGCFNDETEKENTRKIHRFVDRDFIDFTGNNKVVPHLSECVKRSRIFDLVIKLAQKYRNKNWDKTLPVPDNLIPQDSNKLPIEIRHVPLKANHGAVWKLVDGWLIHLNSKDTPARQCFTLYHEIFHILSHCQGNIAFKKSEDDEVYFNEFLADHFSASILLPYESVVEKWPEIRDINEMAHVFNVPGPVMYGALKIKGLI